MNNKKIRKNPEDSHLWLQGKSEQTKQTDLDTRWLPLRIDVHLVVHANDEYAIASPRQLHGEGWQAIGRRQMDATKLHPPDFFCLVLRNGHGRGLAQHWLMTGRLGCFHRFDICLGDVARHGREQHYLVIWIRNEIPSIKSILNCTMGLRSSSSCFREGPLQKSFHRPQLRQKPPMPLRCLVLESAPSQSLENNRLAYLGYYRWQCMPFKFKICL